MVLHVPGVCAAAQVGRYWLIGIVWLLAVSLSTRAVGQTPILNTQPLPVTAICAGSELEVTGARENTNTDWTVELARDGGAFYEIPSTYVSSSGRYEVTYRATIPATTPAGTNYRIRVVSKNPSLAGTPSPTILTVYAALPAPSVSAVSYCQGMGATSLSATAVSGGTLKWYQSATGGISTFTGPTPSTTSLGTVNYYVSQTLPTGCESPRVALPVTVNAVPSAPAVVKSSYLFCQNTPAESLSATGQNLLWYTSKAGGTGSPTTPVVSTSQTSQTMYYVSQTLNGCESARMALLVIVNALPGVPTVANTGPAYCQNVTASPLVASGQGLNWYRESSGGTSLGNMVIPDTKAAGNFTYYVSQTINGCESSRSSLTVKVTALPATPSVASTLSYCQKTPVQSLTATGTNLRWYNQSGTGIDAAPTPATDVPGTVSYLVTQTVDNCESPRATIAVTIKPLPPAPGTAAFSICQNAPAQSLTATGQNLTWYTSETGGTGTTTSPPVGTNQASQTTYYVSQRVDGCEGPRASLVATVKALPSTPGITPKNICQFATPESVSAAGENLTWYTIDDIKLSSAPLINTDRGTTFSVKVTQTVNGCEGPKVTLVVNVLTTPTPTVSTPVVELCQGTTAQSLSATGANLKWTDPSGNISPNAPVPSTTTLTTKPDGDVYYVSQTGINGCESPKVAIRVFVQTVPTMSISGSTTTNLGLEVSLQLLFTGVGPYRYKLSTGLTGTATKDTTILVLPDRTTTYQVSEVSNKCGVGKAGSGSSATVAVLVPGIQTLALATPTLCVGASLATNFVTTGTFNPGSVFKLQLAKVETDSAKINFTDVPGSQATGGRIVGSIPAGLPAGAYWVRVVATNPKIPINGNISPTLLTIRPLPTATLTGNQSVYEGQPASLTVAFTGDGPWRFSYRDSSSTTSGATTPGPVQTVQASASPYVLEVRPQQTTTYYLTGVSNTCGNGTRSTGFVLVTVTPLLGIDDASLANALTVYPVPATTILTVHIQGLTRAEPALVELTDGAGRTTLRYETQQPTSSLSLDQQPAGTYILRVRVGDRTASRRIVKL